MEAKAADMQPIHLPLWIVHPRGAHAKTPPPNIPCDEPGHPLAFSNAERLTGFLQSRKAGEWSIRLVADHHDLVSALADVHSLGAEALCIDANNDGSGGSKVGIAEIVTQVERKRRTRNGDG
jgi:hypothetical protein